MNPQIKTPAHTPGPWEVDKGTDDEPERWVVQRQQAPNYLIATIENGAPGDTLETEAATAYLIAAAPELLAACRGLIELLNAHQWGEGPALLAAFKAISKAEGKQP